jgi:ribonuclease HI
LKALTKMKIKKLNVYRDSMLIIYQVKGEWQIKDEKLSPYQEYLSKLVKDFDEIEFTHLERQKNQFTDGLTTLSFMTQINYRDRVQLVCIRIINSPPYCCSIEEESDE